MSGIQDAEVTKSLIVVVFFSKWVFESIFVLPYIVVNQFRLRKKLPVDLMLP